VTVIASLKLPSALMVVLSSVIWSQVPALARVALVKACDTVVSRPFALTTVWARSIGLLIDAP
jgi:hypothetical protein